MLSAERPCSLIPVFTQLSLQLGQIAGLILTIATEFVSPAAVRSALKKTQGERYRLRKEGEEESLRRREGRKREEDDLAVPKVFG